MKDKELNFPWWAAIAVIVVIALAFSVFVLNYRIQTFKQELQNIENQVEVLRERQDIYEIYL